MNQDCTNSGCSCTPNQCIKCGASNCAYHCRNSQYCGLCSIQVGNHNAACENFKEK